MFWIKPLVVLISCRIKLRDKVALLDGFLYREEFAFGTLLCRNLVYSK